MCTLNNTHASIEAPSMKNLILTFVDKHFANNSGMSMLCGHQVQRPQNVATLFRHESQGALEMSDDIDKMVLSHELTKSKTTTKPIFHQMKKVHKMQVREDACLFLLD
jgi:hypothetical protein